MKPSIDQLAINTIRTLAVDTVERAQSGHPGMPMGAAPMAYVLWAKFINQNPENPDWFNRDRFVLSSGHGSALLYSLLHLSGFGLTIADLQSFRETGSLTPGHPEVKHTPGVEATTGPLGQGVAMSIGMAMAERHLAAVYNREGYPIVDHFTYCICGDGDLMEGVSAEAASLAGHLKLGRYILLYDSNGTSLDGETDLAFSENVGDRFKAYGWQVLEVEDGNNLEGIIAALEEAKRDSSRPTLIEVKTTIAYGSPNKSGKSIAHGAPLGKDEVKATKEFYHWNYEDDFYVPDEVYAHFASIYEEGRKKETEWETLFSDYKIAHPQLAAQLERTINGQLPEDYDHQLPIYDANGKGIATRTSSGEVLNILAGSLPELFGGAADLSSSTKAVIKEASDFKAGHYEGRNIRFGVREFAMTAISNGLSLHGGLRPFISTYFVFSDYMRPAMRLSALMGLPVIYILTHDSIAVGQDGPTHQPIEQLTSLRVMPRVTVMRPSDANEVVESWRTAIMNQTKPTVLVLSRQDLPVLDGTNRLARAGVAKGAYILSAAKGKADALLMGSGSEVHLLTAAQNLLRESGIEVSVISFPSWDLFDAQPKEYQNEVLPSTVNVRVAVEMGASHGWYKYVGRKGFVFGIDDFGISGNSKEVIIKYGFTVERVVQKVMSMVESYQRN